MPSRYEEWDDCVPDEMKSICFELLRVCARDSDLTADIARTFERVNADDVWVSGAHNAVLARHLVSTRDVYLQRYKEECEDEHGAEDVDSSHGLLHEYVGALG